MLYRRHRRKQRDDQPQGAKQFGHRGPTPTQRQKQDQLKARAARRAAALVASKFNLDTIVGVGTGSTTNHFIDALAKMQDRFAGCVASSEVTARRLAGLGLKVHELDDIDELPVYVDGADECNRQLQLIKGGGGALTREKILATAAQEFICIADDSKLVPALGTFPLPVEVIPMARAEVARQLLDMGGRPVYREGVVTDNGNEILDVRRLPIQDPLEMEDRINGIAGVVANGIFARRPADLLLLASPRGVREIRAGQEGDFQREEREAGPAPDNGGHASLLHPPSSGK